MDLNNLGFIFEAGYNIGILAFLKEKKEEGIAVIEELFLSFLENILKSKDYKRENIYIHYTSQISDENSKNIVKKNIDYILYKGIICGRNFCREFIENKTKGKVFKVEYFQADFHDLLRKESSRNNEEEYFKKIVNEQLKLELSQDEIGSLMNKGETFKADSILLISVKEKYHLCIVDNAISLKNIMDYSNINNLKSKYRSAIFNKRATSNFSNLAIDTKGLGGLNVSQSLCNYILALDKKDKPLFKMIQAGSYGYSFISLLLRKNYISEDMIESVCIVGYTDDEVSSINISKEDINLFYDLNTTCQEVLKYFNKGYKASDRTNKESELNTKINDVYSRIRTNFKRFFDLGEEFKSIIDLEKNLNKRVITEVLSDYQNTAGPYMYNDRKVGFRSAHAEEITKYIGDKNYKLLFLTGNPGIGKTTSIVEYLKQQDSYIFMYVSPRIQVNKDIEEKFSNANGGLYDDNAIYLTANGNDENYLNGNKVNVVNFTANNSKRYSCIETPIKFLENKRERDFSIDRTFFQSRTSKEFCVVDNYSMGVLKRLTTAINSIIDAGLSNKIISTAAVQSLKSLGENTTTAGNFNNIFKTIINRKSNSLDLNSFREFAKKYKNIIFMVDEITGDESGVQFLQEVMQIVFGKIYNKLPNEEKDKINFKIIVADASITDIGVIQKHLSSKENDSDKIYYRVKASTEENQLDVRKFLFRDKYESIYINTNSYPARNLIIDYKLYINAIEVNEEDKLYDSDIREIVNKSISHEAVDLILTKSINQVIVYIQDIKRIEEVTSEMKLYYNKITRNDFILGEDYIEINSSISEKDREDIFKVKDKVKIVIMTSSASRGLSFPNTTAILVDMPKFNIEKNIMEILQLVYRGRGNENIDVNSDKFIKFYIGDTIYYKQNDNVDIVIKQSMISIMTLLMILKASLLTRINGYAKLGKNNIALVPIGGKGVSANEDMLIESFSSLIRNIRKEVTKNKSNVVLNEVYNSFMQIFSSMKFETNNCIYNIEVNKIATEFYQKWSDGLFNLLNFKPFYDAYILGDIAIFRLKNEVNSSLNLIRETIINDISTYNTINRIFSVVNNNPKLPDTVRNELRKAAETLRYFVSNKNEVSMILIDKSNTNYRFVAIPLISPFILKELEQYTEGIDGTDSLRDILESYIRSFYEIGNTLPITSNYGGVPFITFKSASLLNIRKKIFSDKYMFSSSEINLLNLLLID